MRRAIYRTAIITLLAGGIALASQTQIHAAQHQHGQHAKKHDHATHQHTDICAGFVVLPNGYAVLSAMASGHKRHMNHTMAKKEGMDHKGHIKGAMAKKEDMAHKGHMQHAMAKDADHLMGHKHGDDIPTGKDMTCVPIGDMASTSWTSVSPSPNLQVQARSVKGALAHNSRANEALSLHVKLNGQPVEQGAVRLIVRMPHHDHRMAGGHGPANDPDVEGLEMMPEGNGAYAARVVDFSMGGPWLFEVQVQAGGAMHKAYFASEIGEE